METQTRLASATTSASPRRTYARLLDRLARLIEQSGVSPTIYAGARSYFQDLEPAAQSHLLQHLRSYVDICAETVNEGLDSALVDRRMLWRALVNLKLRPRSDILALITDGELIEIYDTTSWVQLFRSFSFFHVCSYSLDEILCRPWFELYDRDATVTERLSRTVGEALMPGTDDPKFYDVGPHILSERDSPKRYRFQVESRFVSRLHDESGRVVAVVNVARSLGRL